MTWPFLVTIVPITSDLLRAATRARTVLGDGEAAHEAGGTDCDL